MADYDFTELRGILQSHIVKYPLLDILDAAKLMYQHELGCEHAISQPYSAFLRLREEYAALRQQRLPLIEDIGNGFSRVDLRALEANGVTVSEVFDWFYKTSSFKGDTSKFVDSLRLLRDESFGFDPERLDRFFDYYTSAGCPPVHHSPRYTAAYAPAYRVIRTELAADRRII